MSEIPTSDEIPKRPEGAPDHPYYHLGELPPEQAEIYAEVIFLSSDFFYTLAKIHRKQDYRLAHLDEIEQPSDMLFPWMKSAREEALDIGEAAPEKVLGWFQEWREDQLKRANAFHEKEKADGAINENAQRWVTAADNIKFEDTYLYGSFYVEQMRLGRYTTDTYSEYFPKTVDLMKQALEVKPKELAGSPGLPSGEPHIISGIASKPDSS